MPGTLHIFRLKPDPQQYQVNYNIGANTYVQVFDPDGVSEFVTHATGLSPESAAALLDELRASGHASEASVDLPESHLGEMGFAESPSDE